MSIGSEMSGSVRDIRIQHNVFTASQYNSPHPQSTIFLELLPSCHVPLTRHCRYGFNVKSGRGRGGEVRNVLFAHNTVALTLVQVGLNAT